MRRGDVVACLEGVEDGEGEGVVVEGWEGREAVVYGDDCGVWEK